MKQMLSSGRRNCVNGWKIITGVENNRSFYSAPDVAKIVVRNGSNYYNIAIGSGDRALPKSNVTTRDRFYSIRDYYLGALTQADYNSIVAITDSGPNGLAEVDGNAEIKPTDGVNGWKLELAPSEKVLTNLLA